MINAMTVDVEEHFHVSAFSDVIDPEDWAEMPSRVGSNTDRLLDLFEESGIRATFFVLGCVAAGSPDLVRKLADAGHEIASHGWSHQLVFRQDPDQFRSETRRSKDLLEDLIGQPVRGYRAASYSITRASLWALDVLVDLGFQYDSSIFPVHHDVYGIPGGVRQPHVMTTPAGASIVEFPISTAELAGMRLPVAGGGYFRLFPYALSSWGLKSINKEGQPFVFYMHPWEFDPDQPRVAGAGLKSRFRHYTNLRRFEPRLRRLLDQFDFASCRDVLGSRGLLGPDGMAVPGDQALG